MSNPAPLFNLPSRLCVSVTAETPAQLITRASALLPAHPFLELRLDYLANPEFGIAALEEWVRQQPDPACLLATCRPQGSGGRLAGGAPEEVDCLSKAAQAGFKLVDLSLETAESLGIAATQAALHRLRAAGARVQLSFHDFAGSGDLPAVLARMHPFAPDLYKVVPTANSLRDSLALLDFLRVNQQGPAVPLAAMSMGEHGLITRVLGPAHGSLYTFAAASEAEATAPGQLTADVMQSLYRVEAIGPETRLFGVAGDPIRSSLSPLMHNTALHHEELNAVYLPLKTSNPDELSMVARGLGFTGLSVTMPLKQTVLPLLDWVDPLARRIGAVNTVHCTEDGRFLGYNTDAAGIVTPLERRRSLQGARVLVLGAGGAARAAVFGCADRGAQVFLCNRTRATAEALALEAKATVIAPADLGSQDFDILINTTPAGMRGNALQMPLQEEQLRAGLVFDLVYNPLRTPLLALAEAKGILTIAGIEMFVHQGARQFELWTGKPAPVELMQQVVLQKLQSRQ